MDYLYDGTFEGLLTCIHHHYKKEHADGIYDVRSYQQSILNCCNIVETDAHMAGIVAEAMEFLIFAFRYGKNTMNFYTHDKVLPLNTMVLKVKKEVHSFLGILRFSDIGGVLYSKLSPDNDILILLIEHFADRYKYEKFIIYDEKRMKAAVYADNLWEIKENIRIENMEYSIQEKTIHELWKQYFTDLAIKERINTDLQFKFVPARYRKNMTEFK